MSIKLNSIITFAVGALIGSAVTWKFVDEKYKRIAQEEIDSMREYYRKKEKPTEEFIDSESERCEKIREETLYKDIASRYTNKEVDQMTTDKPYVIPPEEYGDIDGYECISLNYYADGVVADDFDNIIENVEYMIGEESLEHFGEYEDDCVFVRNDTTRCDYEILRDTRYFEDIMNGNEEE